MKNIGALLLKILVIASGVIILAAAGLGVIQMVIARTIHQNRGYPATGSQIKDNTVYYVFASFEQRRHSDTNLLAVLGEVEVFASDDYRHSTTNRLFELKEPLLSGHYYRSAHQGRDGQVSFTKIGSPVAK